MILNTYIHEQLAATHRQGLLEAAEQARLAAQSNQRASARHPSGWARRARGRRGRAAAVEACLCAPRLRATTG
jgi:hypothetical protein